MVELVGWWGGGGQLPYFDDERIRIKYVQLIKSFSFAPKICGINYIFDKNHNDWPYLHDFIMN